MSVMALPRIIGAGLIILVGIYGGLLSGAQGIDVLLVFQVLNAVMHFIIMTLAFEWHARSLPK
jgi:hypothetical protein